MKQIVVLYLKPWLQDKCLLFQIPPGGQRFPRKIAQCPNQILRFDRCRIKIIVFFQVFTKKQDAGHLVNTQIHCRLRPSIIPVGITTPAPAQAPEQLSLTKDHLYRKIPISIIAVAFTGKPQNPDDR